jgi:phage baseplate assembly protein W
VADIEEILLRDLQHSKDLVADDGDLATLAGLANIKAAVLRRIMTTKGSVVHRPDYGCNLKALQNSPVTLAVKEKFAQELVDQFKNESRIEAITQVSFFNEDKSPEQLRIVVKFKVAGYGEASVEIVPFGEE